MDKHLILLSALYNHESIQEVERQVVSIFLHDLKDTTDILILTQTEYEKELDTRLNCFGLTIHYLILNVATPFEASIAKLKVFEYPLIHTYKRVIILDSSVLVYNSLSPLLKADLDSSKLYAIEEGWLTHPWWGGDLFHPNAIRKDMTGFSTSILLFHVNDQIKKLFKDILFHAAQNNSRVHTDYLDQPYIIYHSVTYGQYETQFLKRLNEENEIFLRVSRLPMTYTKTIKMNEFMKRIYTRFIKTVMIVPEEKDLVKNVLEGRHYRIKDLSSGILGSIDFLNQKVTIHLGPSSFWGYYDVLNRSTCQANYGHCDHLLLFNTDKTFFISIRKSDLNINYGYRD